jgi:putative transposase
MPEIIALTLCLAPHMSTTSLRQLRHMIAAMLCMSGRVTTLGLSRWTEKGGSVRTLQRWMQTPMDWGSMLWVVVCHHLLDADRRYIMAADEVVVSKSGKKTHGLGRFYSSLAQRAIPGVSFLAVSLVDVEKRRSYPVLVEQRRPVQRQKAHAPAEKRGRGRPKGSKNHAKAAPSLSAELTQLGEMLRSTLRRIRPLNVTHLALDGFFGTYPATWVVQQTGLHLVSKLRHNAALYLQYSGPKPRRGPTKRYGDKLDYKMLPDSALVQTIMEDRLTTYTYHLTVLHKDFPCPLNLVVLVRLQTDTGKRAHVLLFSTDLTLSPQQLVDYYSLRFQIEFNFRDAKQFWGLEDFMNTSEQAVTNAVNLAFLMVNLSAVLLQPFRLDHPDFSVLDLKAHYRARRYLTETIKSLPVSPDDELFSRLWHRFSRLGGIRSHPILPSAA